MKFGLILMSLVLATGCSGPKEQPLIEGPLSFLEVKTSETTREGGGGFTMPVHGRLYREFLLVTYNPGAVDEYTEAIPAHRIWKVEFGNRVGPPPQITRPQPPAKSPPAARKGGP
jgi:hypothetical protein